MIILVLLVASIILALLRGGSLGNLTALKLRWRGIIILGFLIQVLIFSPLWQDKDETKLLTPLAYLISLGLLLLALAANYRISGIKLITFGFILNFIAIAANGGYMPAAPAALQIAGLPVLQPGQVANNSIGMSIDTRLFFLTDIFSIPKGFSFPNVFSLGDVLIAIGMLYFVQKTLVVSSRQPPAGTLQANRST